MQTVVARSVLKEQRRSMTRQAEVYNKLNYRGPGKLFNEWSKEEKEELLRTPHVFASDPENKGWMIVTPYKEIKQ